MVAKFLLSPHPKDPFLPYALLNRPTHRLLLSLPVFSSMLSDCHYPTGQPYFILLLSYHQWPPLPLSKVSEDPSPWASRLATPHARAQVFKRNGRKLFIFHFGVCLFVSFNYWYHNRFFFSIAFYCRCIVFYLHYELNGLLRTSLETQSFITDMTSLEMGSEF